MLEEKKIDAKLIMSIIATGVMSFSGVVVETAMNITFPALMTEFNVGTSMVQWITTGYLLILAAIIPASSYLKRRFPLRQLFMIAMGFFLIGTVLSACAPTFIILLLGRLIQGVGTGIALPLMFNIILEQVPNQQLGLMMGIASLITGMAPAVGPSLGGMLVSSFGWRMIFISLLPLLLIAFVMGSFSIRQSSQIEKTSFQIIDYLFLVIGFACFIFATSQASNYGWLSGQVLGLFGGSLLCLIVFGYLSLHRENPLIRLEAFKYIPFSLSVLVLVLTQATCLGLGYLIPNFAQLVLHEEAFVAGCLLLPGCIVGAVLAPISGRLLDRFGPAKPILTGNVCIIIATVGLALMSGRLSIMVFLLFYLFFSLGQGFSVGNTMTNGLKQLPKQLNPDGNAIINTLQQLAGAIGTSVITTIVSASQTRFSEDLAYGTLVGSQHAFYLLAIIAVCIILLSIRVFHLSKAAKK